MKNRNIYEILDSLFMKTEGFEDGLEKVMEYVSELEEKVEELEYILKGLSK